MSANLGKWILFGLILVALCAALFSIIAKKPDVPEACRQADEAMEAQDFDFAIDMYIQCLGSENLTDDMKGRIYYLLGNAYVSRKSYEQAAADYGEAIRLIPDFGWAYNNKCWVNGLLRRPEKALPDCEAALRLLPDQPEVLDSRALIHWQLGDTGKARADLERAHRIDATMPSAEDRIREFEAMF